MKRVKRGIAFDDDELALSLIKEIGPGGSFITAKHTIKRMKTEAVMTKIADRDARLVVRPEETRFPPALFGATLEFA